MISARPDDGHKAPIGGVLELDIEDIVDLLPHTPPMLLLDRVISLVPATHAVGIKAVSGNEAGLCSRRTGFVFPSTFVLEALVQLASVTLAYRGDGAPDTESERAPIYMLASVERMKVSQEMASGDCVYLTTSIHSLAEGHYRVNGEAELGGETFVDTEFDLQRVPWED